MLMGHYSAALVAKAVRPQLPLWQLFIAAQFVDFLWVGLAWFNIEYFSLNFSLPTNPLVLEHQPYSHSVVATLLWSGGAVLFGWLALRAKQVAWLFGAVVASHWVLDFLVHRPDLLVWADIKVGLGLWNYETAAMALELALLALAGGLCIWHSPSHCRRWYAGLVLLLLAATVVNYQSAMPHSTPGILLGALAVFLTTPLVAWWLERQTQGSPVTYAIVN